MEYVVLQMIGLNLTFLKESLPFRKKAICLHQWIQF